MDLVKYLTILTKQIMCNKLNEYKPVDPYKIDTKNEILAKLKIIEDKLIDMFSTPTIFRKVNYANYKVQVLDKSKQKSNSGDTHHAEAILHSNNLKKQKSHKKLLINQ